MVKVEGKKERQSSQESEPLGSLVSDGVGPE